MLWKTSKNAINANSSKDITENAIVLKVLDSNGNSLKKFSFDKISKPKEDELTFLRTTNELLEDIRKTFYLLQILNQTKNIKIAEIAEELRISKTDLMEFIIKNKDLFILQIPKSSIGLEIAKIYDSLEENPFTKEYIAKKIEDNKKRIWFVPIREYNSIAGWQFIESSDIGDSELNPKDRSKSLWKNTKEKANEIKKLGFLHKQQFYFGPFNERQPRIYDNAILEAERKEVIEKFKNAGWEAIFEG